MRTREQILSDLHWKHERLHDSQEAEQIWRLEAQIKELNAELKRLNPLDSIADVVLRYRPKPKSKPAKKRQRTRKRLLANVRT